MPAHWALLFFAASFAANVSAAPSLRIEEARLVATSGAWSIDAGVVLTLVRLDLVDARGLTQVYAVQLRRDEQIPTPGQTCTVEATQRRVDGATADGARVRGLTLFADHIACDGREYLSDG